MSVRYIWEKSTFTIKYSTRSQTIDKNGLNLTSTGSHSSYAIGLKNAPSTTSSSIAFTASGRAYAADFVNSSIDTNDYQYLIYDYGEHSIVTTPGISTISSATVKWYLQRRWTNTDWKLSFSGTKDNIRCSHSGTYYDFYRYYKEIYYAPDEFIAYVSSNSASAYPDFDIDTDNLFYYSCDNDVIDPDAVTIPSLILYNDTITIELTESEDAINNSYGTISYTYQYKVDSGPWTNITTTSETSQTLKVPSGTSKIQVRALAKDNIGFTSSTYIYSDEVSVYASAPPSAPSYISVNRVIAGWQSTVTWGESTDSDGTIQNYTLERNYSQTGWNEVQSSLSRSFSESIQSSWTTVQYRVKAVDNSGTPSPYTTSELYQIKSDILMISGPTLKNFGIKMGTFGFSVEVYIAGTPSSNTVNVEIKVDDSVNYSQTVVAGTEALTEIDTTTLSEGDHTITVTATKGGYDTAVETYTFRIQSITLPSGGNVLQFQDSEGKPIMPVTIAKAVLLSDGTDLETKINSIESQMS